MMNRSKKKRQWRENGASPSRPLGHQFIRIGRFHRNPARAEEYVLSLFRSRYPELTLEQARTTVFSVGEGEQAFRVGFQAAVAEARERGCPEPLRCMMNAGDQYFTFGMALAVDGEGTSVKLGFAGQEQELATPMRQGAIEEELTEDILVHRREAAEGSRVGTDFRATARHFRSYLLACCALVESFLNRCVLIDVAEGRASVELTELQVPCNVERRFELWLSHFARRPLSAVTRGPEWDHYSELRRMRNSLMHAQHSMLGLGLKDAARQLNLVRRGVGGLIILLRSLQGLPPVPFAERLETAPECEFVSQVARRTR